MATSEKTTDEALPARTPAEAYDVAVVGGSVAGCATARLFAQAGARVALIERRTDPDAYKVTCTHAILAPSTPVIERLGLAPLLVERGVPRTWAQFWTPYSGWIGLADELRGWGVTRSTLDPLLRDLATNTPGVDYFPGWTATRINYQGDRPTGVELKNRKHETLSIRAALVVGADGRGSATARLAQIPGRVRPHNRFFYFAYWRGVEPARPQGQADPAFRVWVVDPHGGAHFPNEDGLTVLVASWPSWRLDEIRADREGSYLRLLNSLPDGPDLSGAERVSKILGKIDMPNVWRPAARPGIAFVGDAALATDPLFGVGISFAFLSAQWLVDETSNSLDDQAALDRALARYRRKYLWRLGFHQLQIADFATARPMRAAERLAFRTAAHDPTFGRPFAEVMSRTRHPLSLLDPRICGRLLFGPRLPAEINGSEISASTTVASSVDGLKEAA